MDTCSPIESVTVGLRWCHGLGACELTMRSGRCGADVSRETPTPAASRVDRCSSGRTIVVHAQRTGLLMCRPAAEALLPATKGVSALQCRPRSGRERGTKEPWRDGEACSRRWTRCETLSAVGRRDLEYGVGGEPSAPRLEPVRRRGDVTPAYSERRRMCGGGRRVPSQMQAGHARRQYAHALGRRRIRVRSRSGRQAFHVKHRACRRGRSSTSAGRRSMLIQLRSRFGPTQARHPVARRA